MSNRHKQDNLKPILRLPRTNLLTLISKWIIFFWEDGNSINEEGFIHPPSSSSEELESDEAEEEADDSERTLNNIISKLNTAGIDASTVTWSKFVSSKFLPFEIPTRR